MCFCGVLVGAAEDDAGAPDSCALDWLRWPSAMVLIEFIVTAFSNASFGSEPVVTFWPCYCFCIWWYALSSYLVAECILYYSFLLFLISTRS